MQIRILICLSLFFTLSNAQTRKEPPIKPFGKEEVSEAKREAASYFKSENYRMAKTFYERLVVTDPKDVEYNHKLALCYLNTNINKAKAIPLLEYVVNANEKDIPKDALFDLGRAYHYGNHFDRALETYEKYRVSKKGAVDAKLGLDKWVGWSAAAKELVAKPVSAQFKNYGKNVNSPTSDYKPVTGANDSVVYFSTSRKGNTGGLMDDLGDIPADIFYFTQNDTSFSKAKNIGVNINTPLYEECLFVMASGDKMLIYMEGEVQGDIFISELKGKQWTKAVSLGKEFVTKSFETGACMTPDGMTLFFAAEADGSKTGRDIYKCTRTEQTGWSKPERLSDNINTKENEDFPYIWLDGKTLFFSSDGMGGMGGYDIFRSIMNDPKEGFLKAENIGYPLNTTYDDLGIAVAADGKTIYLSQVQDSGIGESDIYKVMLAEPVVTNKLCLLTLQGITPSNTAVKGGIVTINSSTSGELIAKGETNDATGKFDVALPTGAYKVAIRHPKLGKVEEEVLVNALEASKLHKVMQFVP